MLSNIRPLYLMLWITFFLIPASIARFLPTKYRSCAFLFLSKILARIFNFNIKVSGEVTKNKPVLFVSNHMSYADILILGSVLPGNFVSKAEVGNWPIIGWIAKLNGTLFIDRKKSAAGKHLEQIETALFKEGKNLIIFPEGTTGDGRNVLPFKSSLFKIAENLPEGKKLTIQPVTINYTHINGLPVQANERKKIAWIGDATFAPHFKDFVNLGVIRIHIIIHPTIETWTDRKDLAQKSHLSVESGIG